MTLKKRNEIADRLEKNTSVDHEEGLELIRKFRKTGVFFQNDRGGRKSERKIFGLGTNVSVPRQRRLKRKCKNEN